jgi:hypothetical protein
LCLHRSGSSATAGVLYHLGIDMGEELLEKNPGNPKGHYENVAFMEFNDRIFKIAGGSWKKPPSRKKIKNVYLPPKKIESFLLTHVKSKWGIKDPRMMITFDFWKNHLEGVSDVTYVIVHRPFDESIKSLANRDGITEKEARNILKPYLKNKKHFRKMLIKEQKDVIDIHFHDLLKNPKTFVAEVNDRIGNKPNHHLDLVKIFLDNSLKKH